MSPEPVLPTAIRLIQVITETQLLEYACLFALTSNTLTTPPATAYESVQKSLITMASFRLKLVFLTVLKLSRHMRRTLLELVWRPALLQAMLIIWLRDAFLSVQSLKITMEILRHISASKDVLRIQICMLIMTHRPACINALDRLTELLTHEYANNLLIVLLFILQILSANYVCCTARPPKLPMRIMEPRNVRGIVLQDYLQVTKHMNAFRYALRIPLTMATKWSAWLRALWIGTRTTRPDSVSSLRIVMGTHGEILLLKNALLHVHSTTMRIRPPVSSCACRCAHRDCMRTIKLNPVSKNVLFLTRLTAEMIPTNVLKCALLENMRRMTQECVFTTVQLVLLQTITLEFVFRLVLLLQTCMEMTMVMSVFRCVLLLRTTTLIIRLVFVSQVVLFQSQLSPIASLADAFWHVQYPISHTLTIEQGVVNLSVIMMQLINHSLIIQRWHAWQTVLRILTTTQTSRRGLAFLSARMVPLREPTPTISLECVNPCVHGLLIFITLITHWDNASASVQADTSLTIILNPATPFVQGPLQSTILDGKETKHARIFVLLTGTLRILQGDALKTVQKISSLTSLKGDASPIAMVRFQNTQITVPINVSENVLNFLTYLPIG